MIGWRRRRGREREREKIKGEAGYLYLFICATLAFVLRSYITMHHSMCIFPSDQASLPDALQPSPEGHAGQARSGQEAQGSDLRKTNKNRRKRRRTRTRRRKKEER